MYTWSNPSSTIRSNLFWKSLISLCTKKAHRFPQIGFLWFDCRVQNGSGAHKASYPMGMGRLFPGDKAAGASKWPLTSIYCWGQECVELYLHYSQYIFMAWCLFKHRDNFTFTYTIVFHTPNINGLYFKYSFYTSLQS